MANIFEIVFKATGLDSLSGKLKAKLGLLGAAIGLYKALAASVEEYAAKEEALTDLDSGLASRGLLTDGYRAKLIGLADQLEKTAGLADDQVMRAFGRLTREGMQPGQVDQYAGALKNLSALLGGDVNQATLLLSKAAAGNFEAFGRVGIQAKDLNSLFAELATKGAGLAEGRMETLTGKALLAANAWGDFKEKIGQVVAETGILQSVLGGLTRVLEFFAGSPVDTKLAAIKNQLPDVAKGFREADEAARRAAEGLGAVGGSAEKTTSRLEGALEALKRFKEGGRDRQLEKDLIDIDLKELEGKIEPEEAAFQRDQARAAAELRKIEAERKAAIEAAEEAAMQIADAQAKIADAQSAAQAAKAEYERLRGSGEAEASAAAAAKAANENLERTAAEQGQRVAEGMGALAALKTRGQELTEEQSMVGLRGQVSRARLGKAKKEREEERFEKEAEEGFAAAKKESEELAAEAEYLTSRKLAENDRKGVTKDDALRAVEAAIGRTLTNQERRYREMTGQLERLRKQLENART